MVSSTRGSYSCSDLRHYLDWRLASADHLHCLPQELLVSKPALGAPQLGELEGRPSRQLVSRDSERSANLSRLASSTMETGLSYNHHPAPLAAAGAEPARSSALSHYTFPRSASRPSYTSTSSVTQLATISAAFIPPVPLEHFSFGRLAPVGSRGSGRAVDREDEPRRPSWGGIGRDVGGGHVGSPTVSEGGYSWSGVDSSAMRSAITSYRPSQPISPVSPQEDQLYRSLASHSRKTVDYPEAPPTHFSASPDFARYGFPPPHPQYTVSNIHQQRSTLPPPHPNYPPPPALHQDHGSAQSHDCVHCLAEETERHRQIVNGVLSIVASSDPHLYASPPLAGTLSPCSDSEASYNFGTLRSPSFPSGSEQGETEDSHSFESETGQHFVRPEQTASSASPEEPASPPSSATFRPTYLRRYTAPAAPLSRTSNRTAPRAVFQPSPQSMLAPGANPSAGSISSKGRKAVFPGTNKTGAPTDEDFAKMPTRKSRGRRAPDAESLLAEIGEDIEVDVSDLHLPYAGYTKRGKVKKVYVCKVPDCGKCFKRSEHLKRHIRSIHSDERREFRWLFLRAALTPSLAAFQCQWPSCGRRFTRHDNLAQHLRVHRAPDWDDATFSSLLEQCFGPREDRRIPPHRQRQTEEVVAEEEEMSLSPVVAEHRAAPYPTPSPSFPSFPSI